MQLVITKRIKGGKKLTFIIMGNNKKKIPSEKEDQKEKEQNNVEDKKSANKGKPEEEGDFGGIPARKFGKNLGCGG